MMRAEEEPDERAEVDLNQLVHNSDQFFTDDESFGTSAYEGHAQYWSSRLSDALLDERNGYEVFTSVMDVGTVSGNCTRCGKPGRPFALTGMGARSQFCRLPSKLLRMSARCS